MYKIVFFDIDGTLLTSTHEIPESTSRSIEELRNRQVIPAIASGRTPFNIEPILKATGIESYIVYNGALVIHKNKVLHRILLEPASVQSLREMALANHDAVIWNEERHFSIHSLDPAYAAVIRETYLSGWDLRYERVDYDPTCVFQVELFCKDDEVEAYQQAFPSLNFYPWMSRKNAFNVVSKDISKVNGIETCLQFFHIDKSESIAFGDGENDMEMLSFVGRGVAMGNASERLKANSDMVTQHVDEHGILTGLKKLRVI